MNYIIQSTWHYCNKLHGETQMQCLLGTIVQSRWGLRHRAKKKGTNRRTWYCKNRHKMKASKTTQNHSYTHKTLNEQGWNKQLQEGAVLGCVWRLMITLLSILIVLCQYVPVCVTHYKVQYTLFHNKNATFMSWNKSVNGDSAGVLLAVSSVIWKHTHDRNRHVEHNVLEDMWRGQRQGLHLWIILCTESSK